VDKVYCTRVAAFLEEFDREYRSDPFRKIHWKKVQDWVETDHANLHIVEGASGSIRFATIIKKIRPGHRLRNFAREVISTVAPGELECLAFAHAPDDGCRQDLVEHLKSLGSVWFTHMNQENPAALRVMCEAGATHLSARIGGVGRGEISGMHYLGTRTDHTLNPIDKVCFGLVGSFDPKDMAERLLTMPFEVTDRGERYGGPKKTWKRVCIRSAGGPRHTADTEIRNHLVFQTAPDLLPIMESVGPLRDFDYMMLTRTDENDGIIARHSDIALDAKVVRLGPKPDHTMRFHFVIQSNPECVFHVWNDDGTKQSVVMQTGDIWYTDVRKPHAVENRGPTPRIHLVADMYGDTAPWAKFTRTVPEGVWELDAIPATFP